MLVGIAVVVVVVVSGAVVLGISTTLHVVTVTRRTTASEQAVWDLWADVPARPRWDDALAWARVDGTFALGATGEVKLRDQPPRRFEVIEYDPPHSYADRFFLPMGARMDWHHSVIDLGDGHREVTFRINVTGPTAVVLTPVLRHILEEALPPTVETLIDVAEQR